MTTKAELERIDEIALETFDPSEFTRVDEICVFSEHETTDRKGQPQKYDRAALEAIVDRNNERILDTGNFTPVSLGHTSDDPDSDDRPVLAFAGKYRLGKIGNKNSRYAIFCDEWRYKDRADQIKRLPSRSPEVWMDPEMANRFFHPIAALGSEAPRLDLGLKLSRKASGGTVERYSAPAAAAAPAGGNTFIPAPITDPKQETEDYSMLDPQDIQQIIDGISQLDWAQWAQNQMQNDAPSAAVDDGALGGEEDYMADEGMEGEGAELPDDNSGVSEDYNCDDKDKEDDDMNESYQAEELEDERREDEIEAASDSYQLSANTLREKCLYSRGSELTPKKFDAFIQGQKANAEPRNTREVVTITRAERNTERAKYRKAANENRKLQTELYQLRTRFNAQQKVAVDTARQARLERYAAEYSLELEDELERCLYSRGSEMSEKGFNSYCETIERLATPSPVGSTVPFGQLPETAEKYSAASTERIVQHADAARQAGRSLTFEQAEAELASASN